MLRYALSLIGVLLATVPSQAQWGAVEGAGGQGVGIAIAIFQKCYVVTPWHVFGIPGTELISEDGRFSRSTGATHNLSKVGGDHDLDIVIAQFESQPSWCNERWEAPTISTIEKLLNNSADSVVKVVSFRDGELKFVDAQLFENSISRKEFKIRISQHSQNSHNDEGWSGSGVLMDGLLIGIVLEYDDVSRSFLAIKSNFISQLHPLGLGNEPELFSDEINRPNQNSDNFDILPPSNPTLTNHPFSVTTCDNLASNIHDPDSLALAETTPLGDIAIDDAIAQCGKDLATVLADGNESPRLRYQLARAHHARLEQSLVSGDIPSAAEIAKTFALLTNALSAGHHHSIVNLRVLLEDKRICEDTSNCRQRYVNHLRIMRDTMPHFVSYELADSIAFHGYDHKSCVAAEACNQLAANLFAALTEHPAYGSRAAVQLAYLLQFRGVEADCGKLETCRDFIRKAYEDYIADFSSEVGRRTQTNLGVLLVRGRNDRDFCPEPQECLEVGITKLKNAAGAGDTLALEWLGDFYDNRDLETILNCEMQYKKSCSAVAFDNHRRAVEKGATWSKPQIAWLVLYRLNEIDCKIETKCVQQAYDMLTADDVEVTDWVNSLRAEGIKQYPKEFAPLCEDRGCRQAEFDLNLAASKTRPWNLVKAANNISHALQNNESIDCGSNAMSYGGCAGTALDMFERAYFEHQEYWALEGWSDLILELLYGWQQVESDYELQDDGSGQPIDVATNYASKEKSAIGSAMAQLSNHHSGCIEIPSSCLELAMKWLDALRNEISRGDVRHTHMAEALLVGFLEGVDYAKSESGSRMSADGSILDGFVATDGFEKFYKEALQTTVDLVELIHASDGTGRAYLALNFMSSCRLAQCGTLRLELIKKLPQEGKEILFEEVIREGLNTSCATSGLNNCSAFSDDIIEEFTENASVDFLNSVERILNPNARGPLVDVLENRLIQNGSHIYAARRAFARMWDDDGNYLLLNADKDDLTNIVSTLLRGISTDITLQFIPSWLNQLYDGLVVTFPQVPIRDLPSSLKAKALVASFYATQEGDTPALMHRAESGRLDAEDIRAVQRLVGASPEDGVWGPKTLGRVQDYIRDCSLDVECRKRSIVDATKRMLELL